MIKKGTVGVAGSKNAEDFNPEIIKAKMKQNIMDREDNADAIAACAQEVSKSSARGWRSRTSSTASASKC